MHSSRHNPIFNNAIPPSTYKQCGFSSRDEAESILTAAIAERMAMEVAMGLDLGDCVYNEEEHPAFHISRDTKQKAKMASAPRDVLSPAKLYEKIKESIPPTFFEQLGLTKEDAISILEDSVGSTVIKTTTVTPETISFPSRHPRSIHCHSPMPRGGDIVIDQIGRLCAVHSTDEISKRDAITEMNSMREIATVGTSGLGTVLSLCKQDRESLEFLMAVSLEEAALFLDALIEAKMGACDQSSEY